MSFGLTGNVMSNPIVAAGITVYQSHICLIHTPLKYLWIASHTCISVFAFQFASIWEK